MAEKKFYLESDSPLQEIGMRAQVISFLIAQGIENGNAINDSENQKRVIVAVRADEETQIRDVKDRLVQYLNNLHTNDFCYKNFPKDIRATELFDLDNPHLVRIISLNTLANCLMLEQTSKGVGAMRYLAKTLEPLQALPEILGKLLVKLK